MSDRELLEKAAKAAGIDVEWDTFINEGDEVRYRLLGTQDYWNPLTDDGDALRLAVKLGIEIVFAENLMQAWVVHPYRNVRETEHIATNADLCAATRRAIVRAAAAIGEEK